MFVPSANPINTLIMKISVWSVGREMDAMLAIPMTPLSVLFVSQDMIIMKIKNVLREMELLQSVMIRIQQHLLPLVIQNL